MGAKSAHRPHPPDGHPVERDAEGDVEREGDAEGEKFDQAEIGFGHGVAHGGGFA